jgi:uncharacterized membrane protein (DUF4010 family)
VRTFALLSLLGALAAVMGERLASPWLVPIGLAAVAGMLVAAYASEPHLDDPGTTTVAAACVCYLLCALCGLGEEGLAGGLAIVVTALLYFKPEIEGLSAAIKRNEQVSALQFLVASFIVLPILPNRAFGPFEVLNPYHIWLMVVLISGIGLASHVALRLAGARHGIVLAGVLGGAVSSTATTVLYARRSTESSALRRVAAAVVPIANLVPLVRVALIASLVAPALLGALLPVVAAALLCGIAATVFLLRNAGSGADAPVPESRNPAELSAALRFGAFYALVLFASAWLSGLAGSQGIFAAALASGLVDIDPIMLSVLNLFGASRLEASHAVAAIALAYAANVAFKLAVLSWYDRRLAARTMWPMLATLAGGAVAFLVPRG